MGAEPSEIRRRVLRWHRRHAPVRGWESERDPYRILVREVMSQQTQIDRVVAHHRRFCERFPSVEALAAASAADVIRAWRGLGYNRRAIALHAAARRIRDEHDARVPRDVDALRALPGVGPYTAAAVAVYGFGARDPVVDTNVARTLLRVAGAGGDPVATMREIVGSCRDPRSVTQAFMDFGARVCTATSPRCGSCPLRNRCIARERPVPGKRRTASRFEGSRRQMRGRLLDALRDAPRGLTERGALARAGTSDATILDALERDGLIERRRGRVRLPA